MNRQDLEAAQAAGIITRDQVDRLAAFLQARGVATGVAAPAKRFDFSHVLWYAGALIVIGALGLFSTLAFDRMGGRGLAATAVVYAAGFLLVAHRLWDRPGLRVPAGLLVACAVNMAPMAIFGLQSAAGLWPEPFSDPGTYGDFFDWVNGSWVYMDVGTVLVAALALRVYPFPFIAAIMAYALWFLSMDLTPWIFRTETYDWSMRDAVSMYFGLVLMLVAGAVDLRKWPAGDFAFWLHLCGVVAFWGGLSLQDSDSELAKAAYCLINIGLVGLAVFLMRRVYAVFGAFGIAVYLGHLAEDVFADSLLFPIALSAIGLGVIGSGIWYFRRRAAIVAWLRDSLPPALQRLRPPHAREAGA